MTSSSSVNHQRDTILNTVGRFFPSLKDRTHVIYNGLDFDHFRPTNPQEVLRLIPGVDPQRHAIALFPHRPEAPKGIFDVVEAAWLLVNEYGIDNLRVLVPRWIEEALSPEDRAFYEGLTSSIDDSGLTEHFVFHDWVPQSLMPALYSLGQVTFAIGSYVETFGNVPYESLACGTKAIVARVGPARELLPEALLDKVDPGDVRRAADIAARIITNEEQTSVETMDYLRERFHINDMVSSYADVILNAAKREPMPYVHRPLDLDTADRFRLAPWCYKASDGRLYNDFLGAYASPLHVEFRQQPPIRAYEDGWFVPIYDEDAQ
jgi:glycosyltransferase involved in cell wall biosynthesis